MWTGSEYLVWVHDSAEKNGYLSTGMYFNCILCLCKAVRVFFGGSLLWVPLYSLKKPSSCLEDRLFTRLKTIFYCAWLYSAYMEFDDIVWQCCYAEIKPRRIYRAQTSIVYQALCHFSSLGTKSTLTITFSNVRPIRSIAWFNGRGVSEILHSKCNKSVITWPLVAML